MKPSVDCETGDFQCLGGIYRDTSLIAIPMTHVNDITVTTTLTDHYCNALLAGSLQIAGKPGAKVAASAAMYTLTGVRTRIHLFGTGVIAADALQLSQ